LRIWLFRKIGGLKWTETYADDRLGIDLGSGSAEWGRPFRLAVASAWAEAVSGRRDGEAEGASSPIV